jgi:D-beta-D-heptose 7-phosphate kinase/D-beta-D-heptose 1-phosphate adenosyltransferase
MTDELDAMALLERFHATRVLVLGDLMLDRFVYGSVERISPEAPIPVLAMEREVDMPGGAANVVRNAAAMGANSVLVGVVGDDVWAERLRDELAQSPTIDARLTTDRSRPTTMKMRFVADRQQLMRADKEDRSPLTDSTAERVLEDYQAVLADVGVVILSDYAKGVLSESLTKKAIELARGAGKPVIVDPKTREFAKYRGATVLTPNRKELELACGHSCGTDAEVEKGARQFIDDGICETMVVTRGPLGLSVIDRSDRVVHMPAVAREVFDVSGAGDTAIAALALGLAAGGNVAAAARVANVAAGLVVAKPGTATVTAGEIVAAVAQFEGRVDHCKLFSLEHVMELARGWHEKGLKFAFANGCFDLLHPGHLSLLEKARSAADRLIVGLNSDLSVSRLKGSGRPIQSEVARATLLASLKPVDAVVIFADDTPLSLIEALQPDVLVKGSDYSVETVVGADIVIRRGGRVLLADLVSGQSTTNTLARVAAVQAS